MITKTLPIRTRTRIKSSRFRRAFRFLAEEVQARIWWGGAEGGCVCEWELSVEGGVSLRHERERRGWGCVSDGRESEGGGTLCRN